MTAPGSSTSEAGDGRFERLDRFIGSASAPRRSVKLTIPDAAMNHLYNLADDVEGDVESLRSDVRVIAAPVVAQFLRDLAARHDRVSGDLLAELADGLDPQAGDDEPASRRTTRSVLRNAPDAAAEAERARKGTPWCDTCQRPSYGGAGLRDGGREHVNPETGWGPDPWTDHVVTHHQWMATPMSESELNGGDLDD